MADDRMNAMRETLALFTEAGWLQNSLVKDDQVFFTPSVEGLDVAPNLLKLLKLINEDPTGEIAACVMWLCQNLCREDNHVFTDDEEIERLKKRDPVFRELNERLDREQAEREGKENRG